MEIVKKSNVSQKDLDGYATLQNHFEWEKGSGRLSSIHSPRFSSGAASTTQISVSARRANFSSFPALRSWPMLSLRSIAFFCSLTTDWRQGSASTPSHSLCVRKYLWNIKRLLIFYNCARFSSQSEVNFRKLQLNTLPLTLRHVNNNLSHRLPSKNEINTQPSPNQTLQPFEKLCEPLKQNASDWTDSFFCPPVRTASGRIKNKFFLLFYQNLCFKSVIEGVKRFVTVLGPVNNRIKLNLWVDNIDK